MMKRFMALLLCFVMVLSMMPVPASAQEDIALEPTEEAVAAPETTMEEIPSEETEETFPEETEIPEPAEETEALTEETLPVFEAEIQPRSASGDCSASNGWNESNNVSWYLDDDGILTISGTGRMRDYSESSSAPWFSERLTVKQVVIESGVTYVGDYAFYYCVNAKSVSIGDTVTTIGDYAFAKCSALTSVDVPANVTQLHNGVFSGCTYLTAVDLKENLKSIGSYAFSGCTALPAIGIPTTVTSISSYAFQNCKALKSVDLPEGITYVADALFSGCTGLTYVYIPDSVTSIGAYAFSGCTSLPTVTIPNDVTYIDYGAFYNCTALTEIQLPAGLSKIYNYCFYGCTGLGRIKIPKGVATIESQAFYGCTGLTEVEFPEGLVTVSSEAFENCTSLIKVDLPDGTANIGEEAFGNCTALNEVDLPDTVTSIGNTAFYGCTSLTEVDLPDGLTAVNQSLFQNCTALESVILPDAMHTIGSEAFYGCTALETLENFENVQSIGSYAFYECDSLTEVILLDGLTQIGSYAFRYCDNLAKVTIPETVSSIGDQAFGYCPKLTDITFRHTSGAELYIQSDAFYLSTSSSYKDVATTVSVPYARDIHSAIRDYDWEYYGRVVDYRSYASMPATSIKIDDTYPGRVEAGLEVAFTATVDPWYSTSELVWSVQNGTGKATIDEKTGILVGTAPGLVTVFCKSSDDADVKAPAEIEILKATANVSSIYVRCEGDIEDEIELGDSVQMIAEVMPGNAMNKKVVWEVENGTGKATITDKGVLKGLSCGTVTVFAIAQDGSEVIGSRVVEIMRYVTDIKVMLNGREDFTQLGVEEIARLTVEISPENANYPSFQIFIENGTGEASYTREHNWERDEYQYYLTGVTAGTVTLRVVADDSRQLTVENKIEIVGEKASYAVAGGYLYYNTETGTITGCDENVTSANIPAIINGTRITAIAPRAFYNRDKLASVTLPSSVSVIGVEAFNDCENISSLRFSENGLQLIDEYAFEGCDSLRNLTIPESVTTIAYGAFFDCRGLVNLTIPDTLESIEGDAFRRVYSLQNLTIPGDYNTRGWLSYDMPLETVTLTGTRICEGVVREDEYGNVWSERMPGRNARNVIIADTVTEIDQYAFENCDAIEEVTVGAKVKSIGKSAFEDCYNLKSVVLPDGIETLGDNAFMRCYRMESINLPDSLKSVGRGCFSAEKEGGGKLQLIDLSGNPTKMNGQELKLTYKLPKALTSSQKNKIWWDFYYTYEDEQAGKPYPGEIAWLDSSTGILHSTGRGVGTVTVMCRDEYTGATGIWSIEIASGVTIRTDREEDFLVSGDAMQLSAYIMPGDIKTNVEWSVREQDEEYATINQKGKLTAKAVTGSHQIEVIARPYDGSEIATLKVWIVPRTTGLYIYEGQGDVSGLEMDVDSAVYPSMQFTAVAYPEGALTDVYWETSDEDIASVDNGLVTFNGLGTVTISVHAADGSGKSARVTLNVTYQNSAKTLTAVVEMEEGFLRSGDSVTMLVYGNDPDIPMDPALLEFGIADSQKAIATVDADGTITAGEKPGTVTVTASLAGDPLGRRVSVKITVKARRTEQLLLHPTAETPAQIQMLDQDGNVTLETSETVSYAVLLKKEDLNSGDYTFVITPEAFNSAGSYQPGKTELKWASSNTKVAKVTVQKDGTALITIKKGAFGACYISAVTNGEDKVENRLTLNVRDFAPRIENLKPVLNTYLTEAAVMTLVPSYENEIVSVELMEKGEPSSRLRAVYTDGLLTIVTEKPISNSSLALELVVTCADGVYPFNLSAKVKNAAPSVTVKQTEKFNLFYSDSIAPVTVTAKDAQVTGVYLADTEDFTVVEYDADKEQAILRYSDNYIFNHSEKADTKATLMIELEGYEQPVQKTITISTTNKKPNVQMTAKSSIINTEISEDHFATFGFVVKDTTQLLNLRYAQVDVDAPFAEDTVQGNLLKLKLTGTKGGTATVNLQLENWMEPIKFSHKVTVETKAPTLKFSKAALTLNRVFFDGKDSAETSLNHSNLGIGNITFAPASKEGSDAWVQSNKLKLCYDPESGEVVAEFLDSDDLPKTGTYSFVAKATLLSGKELSDAKIKVTVSNAVPKVTLKKSTLKLNRILAGHEIAVADVTLSKAEGYQLVGIDWNDEDLPLDISYADGQMMVHLTDEEVTNGTYTVKLYPRMLQEATGQIETLPDALNLRVQIYKNEKISVSLSTKGKLDAIDPNSEICYTVKSITNATGPVTGVSLEGPDAELFNAVLNEDGTVSLKLVPGEVYSVKRTYKVQFSFTICGADVSSAMQSFKVTQSNLKFADVPSSCVLYQSQTMPMSLSLTLDGPEGATLDSITLGEKTDKALLDAMGAGDLDVTVSDDEKSAVVELDVRNAASLQFGRSYVLYLDVAAAGSAEDGKINQIKITVKVQQ